MANQEHLDILKQGVEAWNKWRNENQKIIPDLGGAHLGGAQLSSADLREAVLGGANLRRAVLREAVLSSTQLSSADLREAVLSSADLSRADLSSADLSSADLSSANLRAADLSSANLRRANLSDVDLREAVLSSANLAWAIFNSIAFNQTNFSTAITYYTSFDRCDFSGALGLDSVRYQGPSTIGIDTLYKSGGNIPESFLRGCGLRDWEIEAVKLYWPDLSPGQATDILYKVVELRTNPAIQFNSCFISYSNKNHLFSERLYKQLQDKGVRCWFAPEHLKIGDPFRQRIDEAIRLHDKLLLILSVESVASKWVASEVEAALEREDREKRLVLFPLRIDDAIEQTDTAWAASLRRTRHIGDFSRWSDPESYGKAFERLLRDLKAE